MRKLLIFLISSLFLMGCATTQTRYITNFKETYVPVKCEVVEMPHKPTKINLYDVWDTLDEILVYAKSLEEIVNECTYLRYNNNIKKEELEDAYSNH